MVSNLGNNFDLNIKFMKNTQKSMSLENKVLALNGWYITGLTDGEGSFAVSISKSATRSLGYVITVSFELALQASDKHILLGLKEFFRVGDVYKHGEDMFRYKVSSVRDLMNVIIPHFDKFPLLTQKGADFYLFKQVITILSKGPVTLKGLQEVVNLKASINRGLSSMLKLAFPETIPASRSIIPFRGILDPNWVCGFTEAEGCFFVSLTNNSRLKTKIEVRIMFFLTQHIRDKDLLFGLVSYFGCGKFIERSNKLAGDFKVLGLTDLSRSIIPFFNKYPFIGAKGISFNALCSVASIMTDRGHLTEEGLNKIQKIKSRV